MAPEDRILSAQPITFNHKGRTQTRLGFAAEQLYKLDPLLVNLDGEGLPDSINVNAFLAYVVVCLQAFDKRIAALENP